MARPMRTYTDEFKRAAVARLANERRADVAKDLDLSPSLLGGWKVKLDGGRPSSDRKQYSEEFKAQAVARIKAPGDMAKIAKELGVSSGMLSNWRTGNKSHRSKTAPKKKAAKVAKKKSYYVPAAERAQGVASESGMMRAVKTSISLLRGVRSKANNEDVIHLTAMLVLATLEGKM
jgi:transposase-like protein